MKRNPRLKIAWEMPSFRSPFASQRIHVATGTSQASPDPSWSASSWPGFTTRGQLSESPARGPLAARALARSEDGRFGEAIEDIRALFGMARALRAEPLLVSQLVRASLNDLALSILETVLPAAPSADEAVSRTEPDGMEGALAMGLRSEAVNVLSLTRSEVRARYRAQRGVPAEFTPGFLALPGYRASAVACVRHLRRLAGVTGDWVDLLENARAIEEASRGIGAFGPWVGSCASTVGTFARIDSMVALARLAALFLDHRRASGPGKWTVEWGLPAE